jgi:chemotaxis protein MotB
MSELSKSSFSEFFGEDEKPAWLTTYADMMTLLLVFFIMLYTIYRLEAEEFKASVSGIEISVDEDRTTVKLIDFLATDRPSQPITLEDVTGLLKREEQVLKEFRNIVDSANLTNSIFAYLDADKIVLQVPGEVLFKSARASLSETALPLFEEIQKTFENYPDYTISIRGHTDNRPINTLQFPSNWELSAVRATTVLRYFLLNGIAAERITATGYADLLPIAPNDTVEGRSTNRRVEFVLEKFTK